jgi:phytanoyl-CoA hydroxylase
MGFTDDQRRHFEEQGYLRLGHVAGDDGLAALQQRIDDIMLGRVRYEHMRLQLFDEETGQLRRTMGNEVATLSYRRIDDLEQDPVFLAYMQSPVFREIARCCIGDEVSVFRSMFMNKPAKWMQELAWHQDVGAGWGIDRDPIVTVWTALDTATTGNGCMQVVPGSHRQGVINERHFLDEEERRLHAPEDAVIDLEAEAGEAILLHNYLLHRSGPNPTEHPRRAFSVTYMEAETRTLDTGQTFPVVFGSGALDPARVVGKAADLVQTFYG